LAAVQQKVSSVSDITPAPTSKFSALLSNKLVWVGGGAVAVAAVAAGLYFGGVFGFSGRDICTATLTQAKDFGVISPEAVLSGLTAKSTDVKGRKSCGAAVGSDSFTLLVDVKKEDAEKKPCKDLKKQNSCVALYSVVRTDGMTTYQVREIPPGETDEALAANQPAQPQAADPGQSPAPADQSQGGLDADTAVDNSGGMHGPAQQQAPQQAPQQ
jgi:hypothetical protein